MCIVRILEGASPYQLCSDHCRLVELLQVCPNNVLEQVRQRMDTVVQSFSPLVCDTESAESEQCMSVQARVTVSTISEIYEGEKSFYAVVPVFHELF